MTDTGRYVTDDVLHRFALIITIAPRSPRDPGRRGGAWEFKQTQL